MNRRLLAAPVLALALAACGGHSGGAHTGSVAVESPAPSASVSPSAPPAASESDFLAEVHTALAGTPFGFLSDDDEISMGNTLCRAIAAGWDRPKLATYAEKSGIDEATLGPLVHAATHHLCPQYANY